MVNGYANSCGIETKERDLTQKQNHVTLIYGGKVLLSSSVFLNLHIVTTNK